MKYYTFHYNKKMEEDGIIKGYMTSVDYEKLGFNISAYIIIKADYPKLKKMKLSYGSFLNDVLKNLSNASIASLITGHERDMIVRLRAKNIDELNKCLDTLRGITGILATDTMIILGEGRRTSAIR
ncbi:MAG: Lrp/AsnC family transcriptional regulator [Candidatus Aenigmarchaeota archaeon]|nr:Lrp/AsnC family transcriptional regulator [Candidatus Aenigmarchaeota archaeon]